MDAVYPLPDSPDVTGMCTHSRHTETTSWGLLPCRQIQCPSIQGFNSLSELSSLGSGGESTAGSQKRR